LENHIVAKRKQSAELLTEMRSITARYFVTCLSCPDTFDLVNDVTVVPDGDSQGFGFPQMPGGFEMAAMMGGMGGFGGMSENLGSSMQFNFTKMQNDIFEAVQKTQFIMDRNFM
jgi:hypothetical protein